MLAWWTAFVNRASSRKPNAVLMSAGVVQYSNSGGTDVGQDWQTIAQICAHINELMFDRAVGMRLS